MLLEPTRPEAACQCTSCQEPLSLHQAALSLQKLPSYARGSPSRHHFSCPANADNCRRSNSHVSWGKRNPLLSPLLTGAQPFACCCFLAENHCCTGKSATRTSLGLTSCRLKAHCFSHTMKAWSCSLGPSPICPPSHACHEGAKLPLTAFEEPAICPPSHAPHAVKAVFLIAAFHCRNLRSALL